MDVCPLGVIAMHVTGIAGVEGSRRLQENGLAPGGMMTFPFLASPETCDGCARCVEECPVTALRLERDRQAISCDLRATAGPAAPGIASLRNTP